MVTKSYVHVTSFDSAQGKISFDATKDMLAKLTKYGRIIPGYSQDSIAAMIGQPILPYILEVSADFSIPLVVNTMRSMKLANDLMRDFDKFEESHKLDSVIYGMEPFKTSSKIDKPAMKCELVIDLIDKEGEEIHMYATAKLMEDFASFGTVHRLGKKDYYALEVDPRYHFQDVVDYIRQFVNDEY